MSRTDKDRPYWVIMNDRTLGTVEHHNHDLPRYGGGRFLVDKRGEYTLVQDDEPQWFLRYKNGTPGMTPEQDKAYRYPYGYRPYLSRFYDPQPSGTLSLCEPVLRWYYEKPQHPEWVGRTYKEVSDPSECDLGPYPSDRWKSHRYQCTVEPYSHNKPYRRWYAPGKDFRRIENGKDRTRKRAGMRNFVKEYNTHGEVEDTWQDFQHRHAPVGGGWWD